MNRRLPGAVWQRLIGFADEPTDDDDVRLRKRVGVIAGYIIILGPLQIPFLAQGIPLSWTVAVTMPLVSATNLVLLARTRRFDHWTDLDRWTSARPMASLLLARGLSQSPLTVALRPVKAGKPTPRRSFCHAEWPNDRRDPLLGPLPAVRSS